MKNVTADDFTIIGSTATVTDVETTDNITYTLTVSGGNLAALDGTVGLSVESANDILDEADNALGSSPTVSGANESHTLDNTGPTVTVKIDAGSLNVKHDHDTVSLNFSEDVTGLESTDFTGNGGTLSSLVGSGSNWQMLFTADADYEGNGSVALTGDYTDLAGNSLATAGLSASDTVTIDTKTPVPVITKVADATRRRRWTTLEADFGEAVTGFTTKSVTATNAEVLDIAPTNTDGVYRLRVILKNGVSTVEIDTYEAQDTAGNRNTDSASLRIVPRTLVVDKATDENDGDYSAGDLSLREAVELANEDDDFNLIVFSSDLTGQTLSITSGWMFLQSPMTIDGGNREITLDAGNSSQHFAVVTTDKLVTMRNLTLTNGDGIFGGAIQQGQGTTLRLDRITITKNHASHERGGIRTSGILIINRSKITNNTSNDAGGGVHLVSNQGARVIFNWSKVSDNQANATNSAGTLRKTFSS